MDSKVIFYLVPSDQEAVAVVNANPAFAALDPASGKMALVFRADQPSKTQGYLAAFGLHENNDIRLPVKLRYEQKYHMHHFFFYLAPSGELIIRDNTPNKLIQVHVPDLGGSDEARYQLHGINPRQRVIPRMGVGIDLVFGVSTTFRLKWLAPNFGGDIQDFMSVQAQQLAIPGMSHTKPESEAPEGPRYNLRSRYTPTLQSRRQNRMQFHRYDVLGSGSFGTVSKVVDLKSGDIWAVKEIKAEAKSDEWRSLFVREVNIIAALQHPNIVHFEHWQDFCLGGRFQLFFRLYKGSLDTLLPPHNCTGRLPDVPDWAERLVAQVLTALSYLHEKRIVHRDIKPGNILFDFKPGDTLPDFYVADFGLSATLADVGSSRAGTRFYIAPEILIAGNTGFKSDTWSFAITLGCVLGYWCDREDNMTIAEWSVKLQSLGCTAPYREPPFLDATRCWFARVASLATHGILPSMFARMLTTAADRATVAECNAVPKVELLSRPGLSPPPLVDGLWHFKALHEDDMSFDVCK